MKCVKNIKGGKIVRLSDEKARELVDSGSHRYVSKAEWKKERKEKDK